MVVLIGIIAIIFARYFWLISTLSNSIKNGKTPNLESINERQGISLVIPFRNEAQNLYKSLKSLSELVYDADKFEIIFVNDDSSDDFNSCFSRYKEGNFKIIDNEGQGKKAAVESGIKAAKFSWILCSDSDCKYENEWLLHCNYLIQKQASDLFVLPVYILSDDTLINAYQYYESLSSLGVNMGYYHKKDDVLLASGANLLYKKELFFKLNPYQGNSNIASGDDMFLLDRFKKAKKKVTISYQKGLWVNAKGEDSWIKVIDQRIRWAKKMRHLSGTRSFYIGLNMLIIQTLLLVLLLVSFIKPLVFLNFILLLFVKSIFDYHLMSKVANLNRLQSKWSRVFILECIYLILLPVIALLTMVRNPKWKERKIRS